jgi:RNA polymerase sigma-70 factor (ECF subfamily)
MTREEFTNLVQQLGKKLYYFAFRILHNQEEAEDGVQEVFLKLWKMNEKLADYRSIEALATTMTRNYCIDLIRKNRVIMPVGTDQVFTVSLTEPSPHEYMVLRESDEIIRKIIENMPETSGMLIKLHDLEGKSYEEIAESTGQNINTLRVNISRARKFIRDEFNKYNYERRGNQKAAN